MEIRMKQIRMMTTLVCCVFGLHLAQAQTYTQGSTEQLIKDIRDNMPGAGTSRFVVPTNPQLDDWANIFAAMKARNFAAVQPLALPYNYAFICLFDTIEIETVYVLKENTPVQRGWGTYIMNTRGSNDLTIEIAHPRSDTNTCIMGIRSFMRLNPQWFIMAGTHRYANPDTSSDMAHVTQSVFHKAHQTIATARAIQLHGFDRTNPIYNGYPQIVISNGTTSPPAILSTLKAKYELKGFSAGLFSSSTYSQLWRLGATQNKQGQWSNANAKAFVHIEHELPIRIDSLNIALAIEALFETFTPPNSVATGELPCSFVLEQNYPNPVSIGGSSSSSTTTICFQTLKSFSQTSGIVSLKVFDVLGREVETLLNENLRTGSYQVSFSAKGLACGVYFYTLNAGIHSATRRMLVVK
jgi:hypothetical protein